MISLLLPRTDAGAFVQLAVVLVIGVPAFLWTLRRQDLREVSWFVGGLMLALLGFFALRTVH